MAERNELVAKRQKREPERLGIFAENEEVDKYVRPVRNYAGKLEFEFLAELYAKVCTMFFFMFFMDMSGLLASNAPFCCHGARQASNG
jgi:hypothetical protein